MTAVRGSLVRAPDDRSWDRLNDESPQGSIFTTSAFLGAVCPDADRWLLVEGDEVLAGVPVLIRDGAPAPAPYMYTPYHGLLLSRRLATQPGHRRVPAVVELTTTILEALAERYPRFSLSLHPTFGDVRGFQWFHYHERERAHAAVNVRYTGLIELDTSDTLDAYLSRVRKVRRYEFNRASRSGLRRRESTDSSILLAVLADTFGRQGLSIEMPDAQAIARICAAFVGSETCRLSVAEMPDEQPIAATLFLEHRDTLYYLVGGTRTEARDTGANTFLFVDAVQHALRRGLRKIDVVGVNSPNRGDFKTSLAAEPVPYYVVDVS